MDFSAEAMADKPSDTSSALDTLRARELYKYFKPPPGSKTLGEWTAAPDPTLTSFVQLVTWRLDCPRALVSLIDDNTQYFIAESSKTMSLENQRREQHHQHGQLPDDMLWARCTSVGKQGRLCAYTIEAQASPNGEPKCFEALDMSSDERFKNLPFVKGFPRWKYYCGVPLISKKGVPIGSLFALDDRPRKPIDLPTKEFLSTMGANVVTHLALLQERRERFVAMERSMCLASFVDPGHESRKTSRGILPALRSNEVDPIEVWEKAFDEGSNSSISSHSPQIGSKKQSQQSTDPDNPTSEQPEDDEPEVSSSDEPPNLTADEEHLETFQRAADLLHQALSLGENGLVAILDSSSMLSQLKSPAESSFTSKYDGAQSSHGAHDHAPSPADILAQKWTKPPVKGEIDTTGPPFSVLDSSFLTRLIKKYPRGKMFSIDRLVIGSLREETQSGPVSRRKNTKSFRQDFADLMQCFPGAREIIFIPLWDSSSSRWSGLFATNTSEFRSLTYVPDFIYCVTFCECIMTELGRQAVMAADKQKSDFIGSVSHELRSPLHGILASMEFLTETKCDSFQQSLVQTADSCARTLLDTISMVLDYSKINSFERDASKARKSRRDQGAMQVHMNIYGNVNLAALTEEVVVGVATGQAFRDLNNLDAADMPSAMPLNPSSPIKTTALGAGEHGELGHDPAKSPHVEIIVDIAPHDWTFVTQPGAFRRIVMNLFGNALKYTPSGHIKVKLAVSTHNPSSPMEELQPKELPSIVTLTVSDTGKGISPEYMRTNLFTPFSQESSLNPGTGLGLSLVRALVTMLGGDINIESVVGEGTDVVVKLPMLRNGPEGESSTSTPVSAGNVSERFREDSIRALQNMMLGHRITFFQAKETETSQYGPPKAAPTMQVALQNFLKDWFHIFDFTTTTTPLEEASLVILEESNLEAFTTTYPDNKKLKPALMVLCPISAKPRSLVAYPGFNAIEYISKPFGPYKLARALRSCLENWQRASAGQPTTPSADASAVGGDPEDITPSPQVEQVMISHLDDESPHAGISVLKQGATLGREESMNAQMALLSLQSEPPLTDDGGGLAEYPFPGSEPASSSASTLKTARAKADSNETLKPRSPSNHPSSAALQRIPSSPPARPFLSSRHSHTSNPSSPVAGSTSPGTTATSASGSALNVGPPGRLTRVPSGPSRPPRVLLVDDNKINVRLLSTYLRGKRALSDLHTAGDGAVAVALFKSLLHASPPQPPDIIFMDITMPVLDGFEATREIRALEAEHVKTLPAAVTPAPSLIIALTGLASGRDQMEAFTSGIDLYMTKPVSFKEVGRLLDNWTANGGASAGETVPHGPITGAVEGEPGSST